MRRFAPLCLIALAGCQPVVPPATTAGLLFDDFSYARPADLAAHGWTVRSEVGWPGVGGAAWGGIALVDDPAVKGNRLLRLSAQTDGEKTQQAQLCQQRKFLAGTYAARVRFSDVPVTGPNGDRVVQTFYTISPLNRQMDPDYSELDFEYLPHGGWGASGPTLFMTSWETVQLVPTFKAHNESHRERGSLAGWHVLVVQVSDGETVWYLDGARIGKHGKRSYPRVPMSINFNLWFIADGLAPGSVPRRWEEDVDWVFHAAGEVLTPDEVEAQVAGLRSKGVAHVDGVPASSLPSPCNM
ncbi:glycoside hydrolase family 16 protein [Jeongeupia naejangsanensis]|uniref:Glycoside hydrolase family 16 protein n=1 Tax=Jeongeupia naejangsanensis TaxID=613195 RepID=A0ABS2BHD7_9NEIS|nr:glycoside hydrolase family 16 protein [Jeongeupia naejangsanensis]MBM3115033.1 glycoside hydrolase family 16 protein [Jeongeupia naejangsanensis]